VHLVVNIIVMVGHNTCGLRGLRFDMQLGTALWQYRTLSKLITTLCCLP